MQAAAMRRERADESGGAGRKPNIGATLGAMAVNDISLRLPYPSHEVTHDDEIGRVWQPTHRDACQAEREVRGEGSKPVVREFTPGQITDDQPDFVAALDLALSHVHHMPKQAADRRPEDMQDMERPHKKSFIPRLIRRQRYATMQGQLSAGVVVKEISPRPRFEGPIRR
jgi:hypothetical protein